MTELISQPDSVTGYVGYFVAAYSLGWCFGFGFLAFKRFFEVSLSS